VVTRIQGMIPFGFNIFISTLFLLETANKINILWQNNKARDHIYIFF